MTAPAPANGARTFRPDIQGLRAVAVTAVLAYHAGLPYLPGGYIGVDVFFVISGFLISGHLVDSMERHGRIRFGDFYAKRARRILPASFVVVIISATAAAFIYPPLSLLRVLRDAAATVVYAPNIVFARRGVDYLADQSPSLFQHYWSLGVEEQFYVFWPVIVLAIWRFVRSYRARLVAMAALVVASLAGGVWLTGVDQPWAFFMLPTRAWQLGMGALVALVVRRPRLILRHRGRASAVGWGGLVIIGVSAMLFTDKTLWPGYAAIVPTIGAALVIYAGTAHSTSGPGAVLSWRPAVYIGTISYSLYLVHWPLLKLTEQAAGPLRLRYTILLALLSIPLAAALYRWVETPLRGTGALTSRRPRVTLLATAAVTAVAFAGIGGGYVVAQSNPLSTGMLQATGAPTTPPTITQQIGADTVPRLADAAGNTTALHRNGCFAYRLMAPPKRCVFGEKDSARTMALVGDSHAAQWFPAINRIAKDLGYRLRPAVRPSCPAPLVTTIYAGTPNRSCDTWRANVLTELNADPPDVIIVSSSTSYTLADPMVGRGAAAWQHAWAATLAAFPSTSEVMLLADTPRMKGEDPPVCLSGHLTDTTACDVPRAKALGSRWRVAEEKAALSAGADVINMADYLCTSTVCPTVISNRVVYRDTHHLTGTFAAALAPALQERLEHALDE